MAWYWRLSLVAKTMFLVVFAVIIVLIYWYTSRSVVEQVSQLTAQATQSHRVLWLVAEVEEATLQAHNALRGYALSRRERFRTEHEQAVTRMAGRATELAQLLQENPTALTTLREMESLWSAWLQSFAAPTMAEISSGRPVGVDRIDRSTDLMDQVHDRLDQLERMEARTASETDPKPLLQRYYHGVVILNVIAISLVGLFFYAFASRLAREVRGLIQGAEAIANGQLGFQVNSVTTPELNRLVQHFNAMSNAIAAQSEELQAHHEQLVAQNEMLVQGQNELSKVKSEVEWERDNMTSLNLLVAKGQATRSLSDLCMEILRWLLDRAKAEVGAIMIRESCGQGYVAAQVGLTESATRTEKVEGLMAEAILQNRVITASYPAGGLTHPVFTTPVPVAHEAYMPITYGGTPLAVAMVGTTRSCNFPPHSSSLMRIAADTIGAVMANRISYDRLTEAYDQLSGRKREIIALSESVARERDEAAQKRDLLQAVLNSTGEGIFVTLRPQNRVLFNEHFWRFCELPAPDESISLTEAVAQLRPHVNNTGIATILQHLKGSPREVFAKRLLYVGENRRSYDWHSAPVRDEAGNLLGRVHVLREITKEVESERLKEEFISTVSHELRTPLTSIRGYLELLLEGDLGQIEPEQRDVLQVMNQNASQLLDLINDLLQIEKLTQGRIALKFGPVDVGELLQRVVRMGEPGALAKGLRIDTSLAERLPLISGDEGRLVQVFTNLLTNAIKYTKEGGVMIRAQQEAEWIRVDLQDTGIGIAPEHQRRLFERFFRVDNAYTREVGGVGLGLAITKELVERHGGRLEVESALGQGSTFTVFLPLRAPRGGGPDREDRPRGG